MMSNFKEMTVTCEKIVKLKLDTLEIIDKISDGFGNDKKQIEEIKYHIKCMKYDIVELESKNKIKVRII